jgi:excisionase family DNA binding protein
MRSEFCFGEHIMSKPQEVSFRTSDLPPKSLALIRKHREVLEQCLTKKQPASLKLGHGKEIPLPESLTILLVQALARAGEGKKIVLVEENEEASPEEAAAFLHVSRPYLVKKLEAGEIPFHWVGSHRRLLMADLVEYKRQRRQHSLDTLQQLREEAEDMGLYE